MNQTASMLMRGYADQLQRFTHVAKQRAALLKQLGAAERGFDAYRDTALTGLEIWTPLAPCRMVTPGARSSRQ